MSRLFRPAVIAGVLMSLLVFGLAAWANASGSLTSTLTWGNPDTVDPIQVEKAPSSTGAFTVLSTLSPNAVSYIDATNGPGESPCYRVAYTTTSGVGPYAGPVCKTFPPLPTQAPSGLTVK